MGEWRTDTGESKQVSDSGGSNDDTFTENSASLSAVKIKNEVGEVNTNDNQKEVSLSANKVLIDKVSGNNSDNYNYKGEIITNHNGVSLNVKQVAVNKVSNNVSYDNVNKSEILLNKNIVDILSNSGGDNESRKLVGVSNGVVISVCLLYTSRCV